MSADNAKQFDIPDAMTLRPTSALARVTSSELDQRHFRAVKPAHVAAFELLP
jgi:hypothetical protein